MKTYPITREDGTLNGFEISSSTSYRVISEILSAVPGIRDIKRTKHSDTRMTFVFKGIDCEVLEPWGDNSRYWIGAVNPKKNKIDIKSIHSAFQDYSGPISSLIEKIRGT